MSICFKDPVWGGLAFLLGNALTLPFHPNKHTHVHIHMQTPLVSFKEALSVTRSLSLTYWPLLRTTAMCPFMK